MVTEPVHRLKPVLQEPGKSVSVSLQTEPESKILSYEKGLLEDTVLSLKGPKSTGTADHLHFETLPPLPGTPHTHTHFLQIVIEVPIFPVSDTCLYPISLPYSWALLESRVLKTTPVYMGVLALKVTRPWETRMMG